jgi:hypothetical protein
LDKEQNMEDFADGHNWANRVPPVSCLQGQRIKRSSGGHEQHNGALGDDLVVAK